MTMLKLGKLRIGHIYMDFIPDLENLYVPLMFLNSITLVK